ANVIWGARVSDQMKGKITVMTIITGVKSPWILGKVDKQQRAAAGMRPAHAHIDDELGIEIV
ncbi:TPA: cell division protein FtsZ, partial [Candidatus Woesearchaeota archaeon]|nr:cell division protein FtsZ [Candidatus Woesearchaeota archaeon]